MIIGTGIAIMGVWFLIAIFFFWRIGLVYEERTKMIDWVFSHHTYGEMVFKFWRPVGSFYREYLNR